MKKIFIVKGNENSGKTTCINTVAHWIITNYSSNTIKLNPSDYLQNTLGILTIGKLKVGINSSGDNLAEIIKIDLLAPNCDIIICACRTKGSTFQHLYKNYIRSKNWIDIYINAEHYPASDIVNQSKRNTSVINELKTLLIGLEKL